MNFGWTINEAMHMDHETEKHVPPKCFGCQHAKTCGVCGEAILVRLPSPHTHRGSLLPTIFDIALQCGSHMLQPHAGGCQAWQHMWCAWGGEIVAGSCWLFVSRFCSPCPRPRPKHAQCHSQTHPNDHSVPTCHWQHTQQYLAMNPSCHRDNHPHVSKPVSLLLSFHHPYDDFDV